ncbi:MAG: hypothetical protein HC910_18335 [Spirulinaceae cyanobacterium SM2_1_0]|nr:hypothetical protein [Spirulinaceae cyanobacterium SM2_1_0]
MSHPKCPHCQSEHIVKNGTAALKDGRRQNLYAKNVDALQRVLAVQRLVHNGVRPHWGLPSKTTPAMAMGDCSRPVSMLDILTILGLSTITC